MFDNSNHEFIQWLENLEATCQNLIYKKADTWFESKLELTDIESAFTSPTRIYKSGKNYLVRVNVKMNYTTNMPLIKIFDENELPLDIEAVKPEHSIISILEVQGIKFTNRNFQIELDLKQAMVLYDEKIFENCIIKTGFIKSNIPKNNVDTMTPSLEQKVNICLPDVEQEPLEQEAIATQELTNQELTNQELTNQELISQELTNQELISQELTNQELTDQEHKEQILEEIHLVESPEELTEVNFSLSSPNLETMTLKKPNQVYYEIYKVARKKAKEAKQQAIIAFLEAKNIKTTYMLEDLDDSDDSDDSDLETLSDT